MRKFLVLGAALGLTGCGALSAGQSALITSMGAIAISDLCVYADGQYSKLGNPTNAQKLAKSHLDAVCNDPSATSSVLVNTYNQFAKAVGGT